MNVIGKESLLIQYRREPLCASFYRHILAVLVFVHLDHSVQAFLECPAICGEANDREYDVRAFASLVITANFVDLWSVAGIDVIS